MAQERAKKVSPKQKQFLEAFTNSAIRGSRNPFNISAACKEAGIGRRTFYNWLETNEAFRTAFEELNEARLDSIESALYNQAILHKDTAALIFLAKTQLKKRGYIEGQRVPVRDDSPMLLSIVDDLIEKRVDVSTAALKLTQAGIPLPDSIRIMLSRQPVEEKEPDYPEGPSDDELEAIGRSAESKAEAQKEGFLPLRQKEVQELKEQMKHADSFSPDIKL